MRLYFLISLLIIDWIPLGSVHVLHGAEFPERQLLSKITAEEYRNYLEQNLFTDLYHSYDNRMGEPGNSFTQLFRTNIPGDYHYEVKGEEKEQAVLFLSHLDALSFCSYQEGKQLFLSIEELVLTQIFHTDHDEEDAKPDGVRQKNILTPGCMCTYRPNHNSRPTQ
jgi:hypothetical protein